MRHATHLRPDERTSEVIAKLEEQTARLERAVEELRGVLAEVKGGDDDNGG